MDDVNNHFEFGLYLVRTHKNVRIVLRKCTYTGQPVKLTALLVAENGSEFSNAKRQILVRTGLTCIHFAVVRTVHWFQHINLILLRCFNRLEGILAIMRPVAGGNVKVFRTYSRGNYFLIVVWFQHAAQQILQAKAQLCALWKPDGQAFPDAIREHKEFHFFPYLAVIALFGFLEHDKILVQKFLFRERNTIYSRHLFALGVATPERTGNACYLDGLDGSGADEVRATAKVGEIALCISGDCAVFKVFFDVFHLVFLSVCLKLLDGIGL